MLLIDLLPVVGGELSSVLSGMGYAALAAQVGQLEVAYRCPCGDDFCTSFYTGPPPDGAWPAEHECIPFDVDHGMVILDVVNGQIRFVEVLDRPELRADLQGLPPAPPPAGGSAHSDG